MYKTLFLLAFVWAFAGCKVVPQGNNIDAVPAPPDVKEQGRGVAQAIADGNYRKFAQSSGEGENIPDEQAFIDSGKKLEQNFGKIISFRFLGELKTPLVANLLYAVEFQHTNKNGNKTAHEQLLQLIFRKEDNESYKLIGMRFI